MTFRLRPAVCAAAAVRLARGVRPQVSAGGSYGCNPFELHIGLGDATSIEGLSVRWPTDAAAGPQEFGPGVLQVDRAYRLVEGEPRLELRTLPTNDFSTAVAEMLADPTGCTCSMHPDGE